jgi:hypothetical protein
MTTARYTVRFGSAQIDTTVTSDTAVADEWVRGVRATNAGRRIIVGLDCVGARAATHTHTRDVDTEVCAAHKNCCLFCFSVYL